MTSGGLADELQEEEGYVLAPVRKRGDTDGGDRKAVEEVLSEGSLGGALGEVGLGGGKEPDVQRDGVVRAEPGDDPVLQHAQKPDLEVEGHRADLVQKDRAAARVFKTAEAGAQGPRKGPGLMAEKLAFDQLRRQGGAIDRDEGFSRTR